MTPQFYLNGARITPRSVDMGGRLGDGEYLEIDGVDAMRFRPGERIRFRVVMVMPTTSLVARIQRWLQSLRPAPPDREWVVTAVTSDGRLTAIDPLTHFAKATVLSDGRTLFDATWDRQ